MAESEPKPNPGGSVYRRDDGNDNLYTSWNGLIREVNEVLENPPPDTDCEPLPPIDEVEADHIWTIGDIEEVQDALKETCPDIEFPGELVYWSKTTLDEIDEAIDQAWCDCEPDEPCTPVEMSFGLGAFNWELVLASMSADKCCGATINSAPCAICVGQHCCETIYHGPYYSCDYVGPNSARYDTIDTTYLAAEDAYFEYCIAINNCCYRACRIRYFQKLLDDKVDEVDALIAQYIAAGCENPEPSDPDLCAAICEDLGEAGYNAQVKQESVDREIVKFEEEYVKIESAETLSNAQAAENMAAVLALVPGRYPGIDKNHAVTAYQTLAAIDLSWGKWFNPDRDNQIANTWRMYRTYPDWYCSTVADTRTPCTYWDMQCLNADDDDDFNLRVGCGIRPYVIAKNTKSKNGRTYILGTILTSPNGTPFVSRGTASRLQRQYNMTYQIREIRWRWECIAHGACPPGQCDKGDAGCVPNCSWPGFEEHLRYWSQISDSGNCGGWIWDPLPPHDPGAEGTETIFLELECIGNKMGKDYTAQQTAFYERYPNWHDEHPPYDDRHENYC